MNVKVVLSLFLLSLLLQNVRTRLCTVYINSYIEQQLVVLCSKMGIQEIPSLAQIPPSSRQHRHVALNVDGNEIRVLRGGSFEAWPDLQRLTLRDNKVIKIHAGALLNLTNLRRLDLQTNFINLPGGLLPDSLPSSLQTLDLSHNPLERIPTQLFRGLRNLRTLRLANARIAVVEPRWLFGLESLESLDLFNNRLRTLPELSTLPELDRMKRLKSLHLAGTNPWACECRNAWLKQWIANHSSVTTNTVTNHRFPVFINVTCASPSWLRGKEMFSSSLPFSFMRCRPVKMVALRSMAQVKEDLKLFGAIALAWLLALVGVSGAVAFLILPEDRHKNMEEIRL